MAQAAAWRTGSGSGPVRTGSYPQAGRLSAGSSSAADRLGKGEPHGVTLAAWWALQEAVFSDAGAFQRFSDHGQLRSWQGAVNIGAGFRVVPTFLSNTLLRVYFAQLLDPTSHSLVQFGITQYF